MEKTNKIYIAGHTGLVGSAILRKLNEEKYQNILTFTHKELDLTDKKETETMFKLYRPEYVFMAAAKVGGIHSNNSQSGEFIYDNLVMETNVIESARKFETKKLLFLGSSCIYPKECPQPIKEEYIFSAPLETTNSAYAMSKLAGIEMCKAYNKQYGCNFISVMPCNLYGPNDNFNLMNSHVLPAMIRKLHDAKIFELKSLSLWGDGTPKREFLHVDDLVESLLLLMEEYDDPMHINVGSGEDISIKFLANIIANIIDYKGEIIWNTKYPNGTMRKLLDITRINMFGWYPKIPLEQGIKETYQWFLKNYDTLKK